MITGVVMVMAMVGDMVRTASRTNPVFQLSALDDAYTQRSSSIDRGLFVFIVCCVCFCCKPVTVTVTACVHSNQAKQSCVIVCSS
jgi:hypothetical protein